VLPPSTGTTGNWSSSAGFEWSRIRGSRAGPASEIQVEVIFSSQATAPNSNVNLALEAASYNNSKYAVSYSEGCTAGTTTILSGCANFYYAESGTLNVMNASRATPGTMSVSMSTVKLVRWDGQADRAILDGGCVQIPSFSFTGSW